MARKTKEIQNDEETLKKATSRTTKKQDIAAAKKATKKKEDSLNSKLTKTATRKGETTFKENASKKAKSSKDSKISKVAPFKSSSIIQKKPETIKTKKTNGDLSKESAVSTKALKESVTRKPTVYTPEYYDLPYRYNQTVVKILAQTPSSLFIYWDISDEDRAHLKETYGEHVFEITKPVLIIHNLTMNYSFEIDINDFANSWYLHINDSKCEYDIELGRRPIPINYNYINGYDTTAKENEPIKPVEVPYIYISSSNKIESPNDRVLFNKEQNMIYFKNVKTNEVIEKDASSLAFISNIGRFYKISDLYDKFYRDNEIINNDYILNNPSEGNPSSGGPSSKFK